MKTANETELGFYKFMQDVLSRQRADNVDFIGINLNGKSADYKAYVCQDTPCGKFRNLLHQRQMIYRTESIYDTRKSWQGRYDVALDNRNNSNMEWLFDTLYKAAPYMPEYKNIISYLGKMPVSDNSDYQNASLYHIGIKEHEQIEGVKLYFSTAYQGTPRFHTKSFTPRDSEYLEYIKNSGSAQLLKLLPDAQDILESCGGNLWFAAMDITAAGCRYKLYLKKQSDIYSYLQNAFGKKFSTQASELSALHDKYPNLRHTGIAIGSDGALNLYYVLS